MPFLDWVNKNEAKQSAAEVPFHLLRQESAHGDVRGAFADNLLIQGDNLVALKALIPFYAGRVKCIFIDPPYNTQSAFEHYDDRLEHSQWLSMMYPRLVLLRELLSNEGTLWMTLDDNEAHYGKVLLDEVFGRRSFLANIVWQSKDTPGNNSTGLAQTHNHVLAYRRSDSFVPNLLKRNEKQLATYTNPDDDARGPWLSTPLTRAEFRERDYYPILNGKGREVLPPKGSSWRRPPQKMKELAADGRIWWGKNGDAEFPMEKKFLSEVKDGVVNQTWWPYEFAGSTRNASAELKRIFDGEKSFDTPKPERLIHRVLELATRPDDLVLDSFLGSGTTAAVAHKTGRRYIGIEAGTQARTLCLVRLQKVIGGDKGGVSADVSWQGGGGFRFCTLGDPIFDAEGRISQGVRFATLAAYLWHLETGASATQTFDSPCLGANGGTAYYLLFNGILGDRRPASGNVLTHDVLRAIKDVFPHDGPRVIYGELSRLGPARLAAEQITFKQIPYEVQVR